MNYTEADKDFLRGMFNNLIDTGGEKSTSTITRRERPIIGDLITGKTRYSITIKKKEL